MDTQSRALLSHMVPDLIRSVRLCFFCFSSIGEDMGSRHCMAWRGPWIEFDCGFKELGLGLKINLQSFIFLCLYLYICKEVLFVTLWKFSFGCVRLCAFYVRQTNKTRQTSNCDYRRTHTYMWNLQRIKALGFKLN